MEERPKQRDAERSRAAILDAAEALFAEHGYEAVTLAQVGTAAGVSRGTPGYFYGSKDRLYAQVVERAATVLRMHVRAVTGDPARAISALLDLLAGRPALVKLIDHQRADLVGEPHAEAFRNAFAGLGDDGDRVALIALALCWFPVSHAGAARALGVDPARPEFARSWWEQVASAVGRTRVAEAPAPARVAPPPAVGSVAPSGVSASVSAPPDSSTAAGIVDLGDESAQKIKNKKKKKKKKG